MKRRLWVATALAVLAGLATRAHAQTTSTTMSVRDGAGASQTLRADHNPDGTLATHNVPEVNGAAVSNANPLPVAGTMAAGAGTYANGGVALSTSPVQIFGATARVRLVLLNNSGVGTAGGAAIVEWCRWGTVGAAPAAPGGVGSFAVQPNGGGRDDNGAGVNQGALNCLAESGTPTIYAEQY